MDSSELLKVTHQVDQFQVYYLIDQGPPHPHRAGLEKELEQEEVFLVV